MEPQLNCYIVCYFLGHIIALAGCGLLLQTVSRSVCSVCQSWPWALQEQLNWLWCHLGCWLGWSKELCIRWRNYVLDGVQIPTCEGALVRAKGGQPKTFLAVSMLKVTQQGAEPVWCRCQPGCTIWGWIWLNCSCVAAMWPYLKLLCPLVWNYMFTPLFLSFYLAFTQQCLDEILIKFSM